MAWRLLHPSPPSPRTANAYVASPAVVEPHPVAHAQPVALRHGQLPRIEVEDGAEQEVEEEDCLASASITKSTTTTDVVPSHVRKRTLEDRKSVV